MHRRALVIAAYGSLLAASAAIAQQKQPAVTWSAVMEQPPEWYGTSAARAVANSVLRYQRRDGGWPKNIDMTTATAATTTGDLESTIDNGATTTQIRLLARVFTPTRDTRYSAAALRGIDYLLAAQYPNGGWPQIYPIKDDYSRYITFNDDAMVRVVRVLDETAAGKEPWAFVDAARQERARAAVEKGVDAILRSQVRAGGSLTGWCAQHDEVTLEPRKARTYEHPSLSGAETVGIVRFLMSRPDPDQRIIAAVEAASTWLRSAALHGWRLERRTDRSKPNGWDRVIVRDADAPPLWARFYEIGTNRPMFSGRDGVIRYTLEQIEHERRTGYAWIGDWPRTLLETEYPAWKARLC